jgi:hypothetical protein
LSGIEIPAIAISDKMIFFTISAVDVVLLLFPAVVDVSPSSGIAVEVDVLPGVLVDVDDVVFTSGVGVDEDEEDEEEDEEVLVLVISSVVSELLGELFVVLLLPRTWLTKTNPRIAFISFILKMLFARPTIAFVLIDTVPDNDYKIIS